MTRETPLTQQLSVEHAPCAMRRCATYRFAPNERWEQYAKLEEAHSARCANQTERRKAGVTARRRQVQGREGQAACGRRTLRPGDGKSECGLRQASSRDKPLRC